MKASSIIKATTLAFALVISGCANPPIVQISNDTYMLSKEDHAGIFGSMSKLKADVFIEANQFAESKGKVVLPISVRERNRLGINLRTGRHLNLYLSWQIKMIHKLLVER